ncbi:unnamed protein product [Schistosoma margrebowiei]|uniref:Uncharacterized protein n=1 Tax=Schistosoma margrebowiei TaxID=48269 RepID=A0A183N959_9TREM|nr:unnamed protein product [Schistosoma margrebowiei]
MEENICSSVFNIFHTKIVVGDSQQESLNLGFMLIDTHQQDVSVVLMELMLPDGFDLASSKFTVRDVTTELSGPRLTSYEQFENSVDWFKNHLALNHMIFVRNNDFTS